VKAAGSRYKAIFSYIKNREKETTKMRCPQCGLMNPDNGMLCACGYNFKNGTLHQKLPKRKRLSTIMTVLIIAVSIAAMFFVGAAILLYR
jgi:hypothetical protein